MIRVENTGRAGYADRESKARPIKPSGGKIVAFNLSETAVAAPNVCLEAYDDTVQVSTLCGKKETVPPTVRPAM